MLSTNPDSHARLELNMPQFRVLHISDLHERVVLPGMITYQKTVFGPLVTRAIGLERLREAYPRVGVMARDKQNEFTPATKRTLALRVAYQCSFQGCTTITVGPGIASSEAVVQAGEAAHISGASPGPGGARYDVTLTSVQRRHIDNGIWMCGHHATVVDNDEKRYPRELLIAWKKEAEERAVVRQQYPGRIQSHPLVKGNNPFTELAQKIDLVQQTLLNVQNPVGDLNSVSLASFVQKKYPHSNAILTVNAETGGTKIQFSKPQTVKLAIPSNTAHTFKDVVTGISQGRSGTMDWSDQDISVDASDPVLNEAFAPGKGKKLKFVPHPIKIKTTLFFHIGRNKPLPIVCEYTITPDDGPVTIRPIVSSPALKFEWVLEKHTLQVNYHLDVKKLTQAPFQFADLPLLKLLEQLGTTSGKFSIAVGDKSKTFAEVQWKHRSSDQIAVWSSLAKLLVEASTNLRIRGLIDEDLPWPDLNEDLDGIISQLQRIIEVLVKQKRRQALTITLDLHPNEMSEGWNVQLYEKSMHVEISSNVTINEKALLREQIDMNPARIRFFDGDVEIFAESIRAAMAQCADELTVELASPNAKLTYLRNNN
jgi:hypothetical protein